ncbi:MAG: glycosyltransferase family 9 protein [Chitinophagaceae bacterium]
MEKFLVIQTAFIGDAVLATGVIEKLHTYYPDTEIDFLIRKGNESLFINHPYLREVLIWDKTKNKYRNLWELLWKIRRNKYEKVINLQRFTATGLLTAFSGAKETIGFNKNPFSFLFTTRVKHTISTADSLKHEIDRNNDLLKHFTDEKVFHPVLYPSQKDVDSVAKYKLHPYICVAPASVWFTKQFPKEKWIGFITNLPGNYHIHLLGAPGDKSLCNEIIRQCQGAVSMNLCGELNFLQSAALMKDAVMNYVNDSAPLHFASAVNAPVTVIYCSTVPAFGFGPLSDRRFVVEVDKPLYCRPCGLHGYKTCPEGHFKCALEIRDQQLIFAINPYNFPGNDLIST